MEKQRATVHRRVQTSLLVSWHFGCALGTEHSQGTPEREWESLGKEIPPVQCCWYCQIRLHDRSHPAETWKLNLGYLWVFTAPRGANLSEVPQDPRAMLLCALLQSQEEGQARLY